MQVSMPSASVDLHHVQGIDVVLVHSMKVRSSIAALPIGTGVEPVLRRRNRRHAATDAAGIRSSSAASSTASSIIVILRVQPGLPDLHLVEALAQLPHGIGERRGDVFGQPQRLADIADRAAGPVMNDGGDDRGAVTAIAAMTYCITSSRRECSEIDVDVGRLQPFARK
jgi:hypothetical protein